MGLEIIFLYLGLAAAGAFTANKGVELWKHSSSIGADKYSACVKASEDPRTCRTLE